MKITRGLDSGLTSAARLIHYKGVKFVAEMVKSVLIVDEDLGFVFWLGRLLNDAGFQVWPARSSADAAELLRELNTDIDLLIINPNSRGAQDFIEERRRAGSVKTIAIQTPDEETASLPGIDADLVKPRQPDELSEFEWVTLVRRLLREREH